MSLAQLTSRIPVPGYRVRRVLTVAMVALQAILATTGALVRVTGSGLGCPTWPECFPGSMVPVRDAKIALLHQWIEDGNRMLISVISIVAVATFLAVWRARPARRTFWLAASMPLGIVAQAVVGGVTVLMALAWWTVAIHLLLSPPLVWLSVLLAGAVRDERHPEPGTLLPRPLRALLAAIGVVMAAILVAGTLVTAAGPHAGDANTPRLDVPVATLAQLHAGLVFLLVGMLVALGFALRSVGAARPDWRRYWTLTGLVLAQGALGEVQYWLGVPELLVILHVAGAMAVVIATAALWAGGRPQRDAAELDAREVEAGRVDAITTVTPIAPDTADTSA